MNKIKTLGRAAKNAERLFIYLESNPIIEIKKTAAALDLAFNTTASAINKLIDLDILTQNGNMQRNRIYHYKEYLDVLKAGTE